MYMYIYIGLRASEYGIICEVLLWTLEHCIGTELFRDSCTSSSSSSDNLFYSSSLKAASVSGWFFLLVEKSLFQGIFNTKLIYINY